MEFLSIVSHELKTPTTALKGAVDIVYYGEAGKLTPQQKRMLTIAQHSVERLTYLISDLLDVSRIEGGQIKLKMETASLGKILHDMQEAYLTIVQSKGIELSLQVSPNLPPVLVDDMRIKQVMDNLLSNAVKFTPPRGKITMTAKDRGDFVLVSVSDSGLGIKPQDQMKIFMKFFQVDSSLSRQAGGTGLGLAIAKSIVEMHGGEIWVESDLGKGSTFHFLLRHAKEKDE
ncbi:MAG: hypothetical protein HYY63_00270 [Elusimicrobia bacterium]|nr:hypothetical protein [Elusimicrobiota bacterium]